MAEVVYSMVLVEACCLVVVPKVEVEVEVYAVEVEVDLVVEVVLSSTWAQTRGSVFNTSQS